MRSFRIALGALSIGVLSALSAARAQESVEFSYPSTLSLDEVRHWVDRCEIDHPRLLTNGKQLQELRSARGSGQLFDATAKAIIQQADALITVAPIERRMTGRRLLEQSRRCVKRVLTLSMAYYLTGDDKYARRGEAEMLAAAALDNWNPDHFLDVAEMTFALAIGYDWLFNQLNSSSRQKIREAIVHQGVELPWTTRHDGWVRAHNNWGQVCHGGLTAGALAVLEDEPELAAKTVHSALHNVRYSMDAYAPSGGYPEGPGYWAYGTSYNVLLIAMLESALGSDFGLTKAPGFDKTGRFPLLMCGPSGQYFNYSDGGSRRSVEPSLFWFAERFNRPDWLLGEPDRLRKIIAEIDERHIESSSSRLLPLTLLWLRPTEQRIDVRAPLHWQSEGSVPVTVHRTSWTDANAVFVGFKGGSPSANHGQMDIGSFVLDADGVRWGVDLGAESYHGVESRGMDLWNRSQDSDRWTIFRQCNAGHNTVVIDDQLQVAAGGGRFVEFSDDDAFPHSVLDMSDVYRGQASSVMRGIALLPSGEVLIQDEIDGLEPGAAVRWGMITPGTPSNEVAGAILLRQGDAKLLMSIVSPDAAAWKIVDVATPRNPWDSPNDGMRMLAFERSAPQSGELTLAVLATPGSCQNSKKESLAVEKLAEWNR